MGDSRRQVPRAEIISIGDEITSGRVLDTNSQWISQRLEELGFRVIRHTTVGDQLSDIVDAFRQALERAELIIANGGLGPTADDLTREALAEALGVPLRLDMEALRQIEAVFERRGRSMPEQNRKQAFRPLGAGIIPNPEGTAPGIFTPWQCRGHDRLIVCLPGVPAELQQMWQQSVVRLVGEHFRRSTVVVTRELRCFGAGESHIESMLGGLTARGRWPEVGITAQEGTIVLRIRAAGDDYQRCLQAVDETELLIRAKLRRLVFGYEGQELHDVVVGVLRQRRLRLAIVDCATGGILAQRISLADTDKSVLAVALLADSPQRLLPLLLENGSGPAPQGFEGPHCQARSEQSAEIVRTLAQAMQRRQFAEINLVVGPPVKPSDQPTEIPQVHMALAFGDALAETSVPYATHPAILQVFCAKQALNWLRLQLDR